MGMINSLYNCKPMQTLLRNIQKEKPIVVTVNNIDYKSTTSSLKTLQKHFPAFIGLLVGCGYIYNINKSKDIPEERKTPLTINSIFCSTAGIVSGYLIQPKVENFAAGLTQRAVEIFEKEKSLLTDPKSIEATEKIISTFKNGIKAAVPVLIFALTLRFLSPVIGTPIADKLTKYLTKKGYIKAHITNNTLENKQDTAKTYIPSVLPAASVGGSRFLGNPSSVAQNSSAVDQGFNSFLNKVNYFC